MTLSEKSAASGITEGMMMKKRMIQRRRRLMRKNDNQTKGIKSELNNVTVDKGWGGGLQKLNWMTGFICV